MRLRDFEVPMAGGLYIVERMAELAEFFEMGREIESSQGKEELREKIAYYLGHEDERAAIARAGHARAVREHSWATRFEKVFAEMGLGGMC